MSKANYANKFNPYLTPFTRKFLDMPFTGKAYKVIFINSLTDFSFSSLNIKKTFIGRSAFAHCTKEKFHIPPVYDCECGFYSFKSLIDAEEYAVFYKGSVVVEVELYGEIIEHDIGYRSREIELTAFIIPSTCNYNNCTKSVTNFAHGNNKIKFFCDEHSKDIHQPVSWLVTIY